MGRCAITVLELKEEYNCTLKRYYNAEKYIKEHLDECDYWINEVIRIKEKVERLLEKIQDQEEVTKEEILNGFTLK